MLARGKLPRSRTLKSRSEIAGLLRTGRRLQGSHCTLTWQTADQFSYAVLLSRRHGSAVRRNRLKRLFREAIRMCLPNLTQNVVIIIIPRLTEQEPEFGQIRADICGIFSRLNAKQ